MFIRYFIYFYAVSVCLECTHPQGILVAPCKPNWLRLVYTLYIFMQYLFVWSALTHRVSLLLHVSPIGLGLFVIVFSCICLYFISLLYFKLCLEICKYV